MSSPISDQAFELAISQMGIVSSEDIASSKVAQSKAAKQGVTLALADIMVLKHVLTPAIRENIEKKILAQQGQATVQQAAIHPNIATEETRSEPPVLSPAANIDAGATVMIPAGSPVPNETTLQLPQAPMRLPDLPQEPPKQFKPLPELPSEPPKQFKSAPIAPQRKSGGAIQMAEVRPKESAPRRAGISAKPKAKSKVDHAVEAAPKNNKNMVIGAAALGGLVLVLSITYVITSRRDKAKPPIDETAAVTKPADTTPAASAKVDTAAPLSDIEPLDPVKKKPWLLAQHDKFEKNNPDAFGELLQRLDKLEKAYEKDDDWVATIEGRIRALKQRVEKKADEMAESLGSSAMKKAEGGDFKAALAELAKFPDDLARTGASSRVFFFRRKLQDKAQEQFKIVDQKAQKLAEANDYDGAIKAFDGIASFGYPQIDRQVSMRRAEIKDISTRGANPSAGKTPTLNSQQAYFAADVYVAMPKLIETFTDLCHDAAIGDVEAGKAKLDFSQYPRSAVFYYAQALISSRTGAAEDAQWALAQAGRLALANDAFKSRLICAEARMSLGSFDLRAAEKKVQEALSLDPNNADAHFIIANVNFGFAESFAPSNPNRTLFIRNGWDSLKKAATLDRFYAKLAPELESELGASPDKVPDKYQYSGNGGNPYLASVVRVMGFTAFGQAHGTGWAVKSSPTSAYIITNNHVVKDLQEIAVTYQFEAFGNLVRKESKQVKVLGVDAENDLALLEVVTEKEVKALPLRPTTSGLTLPMKLTLIGHPHQLDFTVMSGELANLNRIVDGKRMLQTNANVDSGMSGGPVIDEQGYVIGVTVAKYNNVAGQALAIITEHVRDLCEKCGVTVELRVPGAAATPAPGGDTKKPAVPKSIEINDPKPRGQRQ